MDSQEQENIPLQNKGPWLAGAAVTWWILLAAFWLILVDTTAFSELWAGAAAAAIATLAVLAVRVSGPVLSTPSPGWLARFMSLPVQVISDSIVVMNAIGRRLLLRQPVDGVFRAVPFDPGGDDPRSAARRALVIAGISAAPNSVVVDVDRAGGTVLLHQLIPTLEPPGGGDREWPLG